MRNLLTVEQRKQAFTQFYALDFNQRIDIEIRLNHILFNTLEGKAFQIIALSDLVFASVAWAQMPAPIKISLYLIESLLWSGEDDETEDYVLS